MSNYNPIKLLNKNFIGYNIFDFNRHFFGTEVATILGMDKTKTGDKAMTKKEKQQLFYDLKKSLFNAKKTFARIQFIIKKSSSEGK